LNSTDDRSPLRSGEAFTCRKRRARKQDVADKIFAVDYVDHNPSWKSGVENIKRSVNDWHAAFPDTRTFVEDVIAEGDKVAVRWTTRATHKESSWASSRPAICYGNGGIGIFRFLGGKIVESWDEYEALGLLRQLGANCPSEQAGE